MLPIASRVVAFFVLFTAAGLAQKDADRKDWIQLFNGKNLDGWVVKVAGYLLGENYANTFRVEDGVLKISYDQYDEFGSRFGHIFYRKRKFSHYIVAAEYRFVGEQVKGGPDWAFRNNGIMFHCQAPETMGKDQDFPISIEAQLLGGRHGRAFDCERLHSGYRDLPEWREGQVALLQLHFPNLPW